MTLCFLHIPRPAIDARVLRERELTQRLAELDADLEFLESEITDFRLRQMG